MRTLILFCGDRDWGDRALIMRYMRNLYDAYGGQIDIIAGGARGADSQAESCARELGLEPIVVAADWHTLGKAAGPIRNGKMLDHKPEFVFAFHDDIESSRGTLNCLTQALQRGITSYIISHHGNDHVCHEFKGSL